MRPRKIILIVDADATRASVLATVLDVHHYRPVQATGATDAIRIFSEVSVDLVIASQSLPGDTGDHVIGCMKRIASHVPMILLDNLAKWATEKHYADAVFPPHYPMRQMADLLEHIKIMSARKRGPRPGTIRYAKPQNIVDTSANLHNTEAGGGSCDRPGQPNSSTSPPVLSQQQRQPVSSVPSADTKCSRQPRSA